MSEASDWERYLMDKQMDLKCPNAREYLQRLMVDQLVSQMDYEMAQILTRYRSYLAVREQRGDPPLDPAGPSVEQLRDALDKLKQEMALEAMTSLEVLLARD